MIISCSPFSKILKLLWNISVFQLCSVLLVKGGVSRITSNADLHTWWQFPHPRFSLFNIHLDSAVVSAILYQNYNFLSLFYQKEIKIILYNKYWNDHPSRRGRNLWFRILLKDCLYSPFFVSSTLEVSVHRVLRDSCSLIKYVPYWYGTRMA
jgi:hypothetical protein